MITLQKIGKLFILFVITAGLASCGDDTETAAFDGVGDVVVVKRMLQEETRYARIYYVYGNQPMSAAEVSLPEGGTITLDPADQTKQTYYFEPSVAEFSTEVPEVGLFNFSVVNEDIPHVFSETAAFNDLAFVTIDTISVNSGLVHIEWQSNDDAEAYQVLMVDENYNQVFNGDLLSSSYSTYEFSPSQAESGKTYHVEVQAFSFEADAGSSYLYNIEEISISSTTIIW